MKTIAAYVEEIAALSDDVADALLEVDTRKRQYDLARERLRAVTVEREEREQKLIRLVRGSNG